MLSNVICNHNQQNYAGIFSHNQNLRITLRDKNSLEKIDEHSDWGRKFVQRSFRYIYPIFYYKRQEKTGKKITKFQVGDENFV